MSENEFGNQTKAPTACDGPTISNMQCPKYCLSGQQCSKIDQACPTSTDCTAQSYHVWNNLPKTECRTVETTGFAFPSRKWAPTLCPTNTYSISNALGSTCQPIAQMKQFQSIRDVGTGCDGYVTQSGAGAAVCKSAPNGYYAKTAQQATTGITWAQIPAGYYKATPPSITECPIGSSCGWSTSTTCASGKYSKLGWGKCYQLPVGTKKDTTLSDGYTDCASAGSSIWTYNRETSSCIDCSTKLDKKCNLKVGLYQRCQVGYYFASATSSTCSICPLGSYCDDGATSSDATFNYPTIKVGTVSASALGCPAGYECTKYSIQANQPGYYSTSSMGTAKQQQYNSAADLPAPSQGTCPTTFKTSTNRLNCLANGLRQKSSCTGFICDLVSCNGKEIAWIGDSCESLQQNQDYNFASNELAVYNGVHCPTGFIAQSTYSNNIVVWECQSRTSYWDYIYYSNEQNIKGVNMPCSLGGPNSGGNRENYGYGVQRVVKGASSDSITNRYVNMNKVNEMGQCQDCAPNSICNQFNYSNTRWCFGKDPAIAYLNPSMKIQVDDRRVSKFGNLACFDSNAVEYSEGSSVFASDYFPDHRRNENNITEYLDNKILQDMIVKCPFQSLVRTIYRYTDQIEYLREDSLQYGAAYDLGQAYSTYAWFDDTEPNIYPYSFCNIDEDFYARTRINSHQKNPDPTQTLNTDCSQLEHLEANYPMCKNNYGGFISDSDIDQPTETPIPAGKSSYQSVFYQNDDYTGIQLMQCPKFTSSLMAEGATSAYTSCHIKALGECRNSETADYCNNGQDYVCPSGTKLKSSLTVYTNTINDCESCAAGTVCSQTTETTTCPAGYNCPAMTTDVYSKPGQPGEFLSANIDTGNNDIITCQLGYCEGATYSANFKTCPQGYQNFYSGLTANGQHSQASCSPLPPGVYADPSQPNAASEKNQVYSLQCPPGYMCPAGSSSAEIYSPSGYFAQIETRGSVKSINELIYCSPGKFCDQGSEEGTQQDCPIGYWCETATSFMYETPCGFGLTSPVSSTTFSNCAACINGQYCQEGSSAPLTDRSFCGQDNFLCVGGNANRTTCNPGYYTTDGVNCIICQAGSFCIPGSQPVNCPAGYASNSGATKCSLSTAGTMTSADQTLSYIESASWTIAGQLTQTKCPGGYNCEFSVVSNFPPSYTKKDCEPGYICVEGYTMSSSEPGTVQDEKNLFYQKPCPAGYYCSYRSATTITPEGKWTAQKAVEVQIFYIPGTGGYCADNYYCPTGSIGPYQKKCDEGKAWDSRQSQTRGNTCWTCDAGSYCFQGTMIQCEPGMYCDPSSSPQLHMTCPVGTYSANGDSSSSCTACPGGYACTQKGMSAGNIYKCAAGYFCTTGSNSTQPERIPGVSTDDSFQCNPTYYLVSNYLMNDQNYCSQGICPKGYYCEIGTSIPTVCPEGTFNLNYGEISVAGCVDCIQGYYCPNTTTIIKCAAGTYCPQKSTNNNQQPQAGSFSQAQYPAAIPCLVGTYLDKQGAASCYPCKAGSQCPVLGMANVQTCNSGSDCSLTGVIVPQKCKYGQYVDPNNAINPSCIPCAEDAFCQNDAIDKLQITANTALAGNCPAGYKCAWGANHTAMNLQFRINPGAYLCREGHYCDSTGSTTEKKCPAGTYMPYYGAASLNECIPCKAGYLCDSEGIADPVGCPAGYSCQEGMQNVGETSWPGEYCPENCTMWFECPWGTYASGYLWTACANSTAGFYVPRKYSSSQDQCPIGYYCQSGSVKPQKCPIGQTSLSGTTNIQGCFDVALGQYRLSSTYYGVVKDGYQSIGKGEFFAIPTRFGKVCLLGSYCAAGVSTVCPAGKVCNQDGLITVPYDCEKGFYCSAGTTRVRANDPRFFSDRCTAGHYCPAGSQAPTPCPIGTYSSARGNYELSQCQKCKQGMYCPTAGLVYNTMILCPAGSFCGDSITIITSSQQCAVGKYCPLGSVEQLTCAAGYYQDQAGQGSCKSCEIGYYCPHITNLAGLLSQKIICPKGFNCKYPYQSAPTACTAGYYQDSQGQASCIDCPAGYFCPEPAMTSAQTYPCPDQFQCPSRSVVPKLCEDGQLCDKSNSTTQMNTKVPCPAGSYCIHGKKYSCYAGYICISAAKTPMPTDGTTGMLCEKGYYCEKGALEPKPCPVGTYNPYEGASTVNSCQLCPENTKCPNEGSTFYTVFGSVAGFYLVQDVIHPCKKGFYCPGTKFMKSCPHGTYSNQTGQAVCSDCPAGYYCLMQQDSGCIVPLECPKGRFCEGGYGNAEIKRCPIGTYHNTQKIKLLKSIDDCSPCPEKYYCPLVGMIDDEFKEFICSDGYACDEGATTITGNRQCSKDHYCIKGIAYQCPLGTYSESYGITSVNECIVCPPGKICYNYSENIQDCFAGYYCPGGVYKADQVVICPKGNYCPVGSFEPLICPPGYYQNDTNSFKCKICDAGSYCPTQGIITPISCAIDFKNQYCPEGSITPRKCPIGYFVEDQKTCTACPPGKYCWPASNNEHNGIVDYCAFEEGYLCRNGSWSAYPQVQGLDFIQHKSDQFYSYNGPVKEGWITQQNGSAVACPPGTFQPSILSSTCVTCYQGRYCPDYGMSDITEQKCAPGYYCNGGNTQQAPVLEKNAKGIIIGNKCPIERECSYLVMHPMSCEDGKISQNEGNQFCDACPQGFYCDIVEKPSAPKECYTQSICEIGTKRQTLCPDGTFNNTGLQYCQACTAGHYCRSGTVTGTCAAGYLCDKPDLRKDPNPTSNGCEVGYFCPKGQTYAMDCPYKTMSIAQKAMQITDCKACQPGYLCPENNHTAIECPKGYYCPPAGGNVIYEKLIYECEVGSWSPNKKLIHQQECYDCSQGYYCNTTAISNLTGLECPAGYYCPEGTINPLPCPFGTYQSNLGQVDSDSCTMCPNGFYCPMATSQPIECQDGQTCPGFSAAPVSCSGGFYCNKETGYQEVSCPVNFYCPRGTAEPIPCDSKHVCPKKTETQIFCKPGSFVDKSPSVYGGQNLCVMCEEGTYSTYDSDGCLPCPEGYLCYGGTNTNQPVSVKDHKGEICPKGFYCPEGSSDSIACPPGTFNTNYGMSSLQQCALCQIGSYNNEFGSEGCNPCGQFATSTEGATKCSCKGKNRFFSPTDGSCRCKTGFDFKTAQGISQGRSSGVDDCVPIIFDRCNGADEVRAPNGACLNIYNCTVECQGGTGQRDVDLGVCTCSNAKTTDELCNQNCRLNAAKVGMISATQVLMTVNGFSKVIDLTQTGDVFGIPSGNGSVKTVAMNPSGFLGSYTAPILLLQAAAASNTNQKNKKKEVGPSTTSSTNQASSSSVQNQQTIQKNRKLVVQLGNEDSEDELRQLQSTAVISDQIPNPVYCIKEQDTFLFSIEDPKHYPEFMKDSTMNTNPEFDFGAFIDLAQQQKRKIEQGINTPTFFTYSFNQAGTYVFNTATSTSQLMIIIVKGVGEKCPDPDRFLEVMSGETLAHKGASNRQDLIIQPDLGLSIFMIVITLTGTGFIIVMAIYCSRKGWEIKSVDMDKSDYRERQLGINIHHKNKTIHHDLNDFVNYESELINNYDDEEYENINFDIQQDLVDAGRKYLSTYEKKKQRIKRRKHNKKQKVEKLLKEMQSLLHLLNTDQAITQLHWLDLNVIEQDSTINSDKIQKQVYKQLAMLSQQENAIDEDFKKKKDELLKVATGRDREFFETIKTKMFSQLQNKMKKINQTDCEIQDVIAASETAIYDNGDVKSRNNQLVSVIEANPIFNDQEKNLLLKNHEERLHNIDNLLEVEKRKQEQELDRAMKLRLDRRNRQNEKLHKKDIADALFKAEIEISDCFEKKKKEEFERLNKEHELQVLQILEKTEVNMQRQKISELEKLTEKKKFEANVDLNQQKFNQSEDNKAKIHNQFIKVEQNLDLTAVLKMILGENNQTVDNLFKEAAQEKEVQEQKLNERLLKKLNKVEQNQQTEMQLVAIEFETQNIVQMYEQEVVETEVRLHQKEKYLSRTANLPFDLTSIPISDKNLVLAADIARKDAEERKEHISEQQFRVNQKIDQLLKQNSLLAELENSDAFLAALLKQQENEQSQLLEAKKAQIKARRLTKVKNEQQETMLSVKILDEEERLEESIKIQDKYIAQIFKIAPKKESKQSKQERFKLLNEFMSDQFLEQLANLLMKQFLEKDSSYKLNLHKYLQQGLEEAIAIKTQFQIDTQALNKLKYLIADENVLNQNLMKLRLNEENLLKETDLLIKKLHVEEETKIRKQLDKKHMNEQIQFYQKATQRQAAMRIQLFGKGMDEVDHEIEKKSIEKFILLKQTEYDRRIRSAQLLRQTKINQINEDIKQKYTNYDEMIRLKSQAAKEDAEEREISLVKVISERKARLKRILTEQGMTKEHQEAMMRSYKEALAQLDSAYASEQRRQLFIMKAKVENKQSRVSKKVELQKQELESKLESPKILSQQLRSTFRQRLIGLGDQRKEDDSELLHRLREWDQHKKDYEKQEFVKKTREAGNADMDENQIRIIIIKLMQIEKLLEQYAQ